jgi:Protein of unknown function (DUF1232)
MLDVVSRWARSIQRDAHALYLASRDPRVPWHAKALSIFIAAYALSPIDLIPDFIPVLGYLDDVMAEHRRAAELAADRPVSRTAALVIAALWTVSSVAVIWIGFGRLDGGPAG